MTWQNWAGTATADPARRYWPVRADAIADAVRDAGSRWPDGACPRQRALLHPRRRHRRRRDRPVRLDRDVAADAESGLVTVRSGTTLRELNADLDALGLAMPNLGDIDAQTISGAISTGTHGTGAGLGGIATQVEAMELVTADGALVRVSAE